MTNSTGFFRKHLEEFSQRSSAGLSQRNAEEFNQKNPGGFQQKYLEKFVWKNSGGFSKKKKSGGFCFQDLRKIYMEKSWRNYLEDFFFFRIILKDTLKVFDTILRKIMED